MVSTDIRAGATDEENEARLAAAAPLGRQATVEDIAALFVWLSSEDSSYITGGTHTSTGTITASQVEPSFNSPSDTKL